MGDWLGFPAGKFKGPRGLTRKEQGGYKAEDDPPETPTGRNVNMSERKRVGWAERAGAAPWPYLYRYRLIYVVSQWHGLMVDSPLACEIILNSFLFFLLPSTRINSTEY